jgi:hypothetical protein
MSEQTTGVDLELNLDDIFEPRISRVSKEPEVREVQIVTDRSDPAKGYISLRVQGLSSEDRESLGRAFEHACAVYRKVEAAKEAKAGELNPEAEDIGSAFASGMAAASAEKWILKATEQILAAARDIAALGVVGWDEGQLRYQGKPLQYTQEKLLIQKRQRLGLATTPLRWLQAGGFLLRLASQILAVSDAEDTPSVDEQWGSKKEEVAAEPAPLDVAPSETPVN